MADVKTVGCCVACRSQRSAKADDDSEEFMINTDNGKEKEEEEKSKDTTYKRYLVRWLMLFVLFLLNLSNGTVWMTYAPIPGRSMAFFGITSMEVDWFSISFFIVSLLVGFVSMFVLDTFGLAPSVLLGAVLNFLGCILRVLGSMPPVVQNPTLYSHSGYILAMCGQILAAAAQPFLLYSPTKFAMFWFGENERATANAITSMANPLGIGIAYILSPRVSDVFTVTWIYMIPAAVGCILACGTFWRGRPPTPPSAGAETDQEGFFKGLRMVLRKRQLWVLLIVWGMVSGLLNAMLTLLPQFLCPFGYDDNFSGLWIGIMIFMGMVGAFVASLILDFTRRYEEVAKVTLAFAILCLIWFLEVFNRTDQEANIAVCLCLFGFFGFMFMPTTLEVAVEITYPAPEAASSGLLWSTSQIFGAVISFVSPFLAQDLPPYYVTDGIQMCSVPSARGYNVTTPTGSNATTPTGPSTPSTVQDNTYTIILYAGIAFVAFLVLVIFFHPQYRRYAAELKAKRQQKTQLHTTEKKDSD